MNLVFKRKSRWMQCDKCNVQFKLAPDWKFDGLWFYWDCPECSGHLHDMKEEDITWKI